MSKFPWKPVLSSASALLLVACANAQSPQQSAQASQAEEAPAPKVLEIREFEVEAPHVFEETALALWDGRPSLGGIWVAHPLASSPERVKITNLKNNLEITGALFRRDASLAGPPFQISSDAAQVLKIQPGSPVQIEVIALRKELKTEEIIREEPLQTATPEPTPEAEPAPEETSAPAPEDTVADAPQDDTTLEMAAAAIEAPAPEPAPAPQAKPVTPPKPEVVIPSSTPKQEFSTAKPYIQVGTFGVASNATQLVVRLKAEGYPAFTRDIVIRGKTYKRVLIGPISTETSFRTIMRDVRQMGFSDALAVKG